MDSLLNNSNIERGELDRQDEMSIRKVSHYIQALLHSSFTCYVVVPNMVPPYQLVNLLWNQQRGLSRTVNTDHYTNKSYENVGI